MTDEESEIRQEGNTNHETIYNFVIKEEKYNGHQFAYKDIRAIANAILESTSPSGRGYATLKFLQQYCVTIGGVAEASFFIGDPRDYTHLSETKSSWKFWLRSDS